MIDIERTRFIVTAWPDHRWPVETIHWIERLTHGKTLRPDYRDSLKKKNIVCARNTAILESALQSHEHFEHFVFIDQDVRPTWRTDAFLQLDSDIKVCQVELSNPFVWSEPTAFHEPIWATSRHVLRSIKPPWFMPAYNTTGTEMDGCICQSFRRKALAAGFTIAHGGWADHDQDGSWCS